ncbi:unnamed protein product [Phytophthora lilii]|uniref:Unnamed protein product n=1 Tax=Phytophthora lilii TaxID=2077276 RepID=A0A9W6THT1_9STRA|nr:unnamed protein product [Phytophthora lilii]
MTGGSTMAATMNGTPGPIACTGQRALNRAIKSVSIWWEVEVALILCNTQTKVEKPRTSVKTPENGDSRRLFADEHAVSAVAAAAPPPASAAAALGVQRAGDARHGAAGPDHHARGGAGSVERDHFASCLASYSRLISQKLVEAAERQKTKNLMLRVAVEGGGCSGFKYVIEFEKDATPDAEEDVVFEQHGGKVVVDKESLELIRGSTVDFEQELIRSAFAVVNNPNAVSGCGCGTSFDLKN